MGEITEGHVMDNSSLYSEVPEMGVGTGEAGRQRREEVDVAGPWIAG